MHAPTVNLRAKISQRIVTKHDVTANALDASHSDKLCSVCVMHVAQYKCPKCYVAYCTSTCYQTHGSKCVDHFNNRTSPPLPRAEDIAELHSRFENEVTLSGGDVTILKQLAASHELKEYTPWWKHTVPTISIIASDESIPTLTSQHTIHNAALASTELSKIAEFFTSSVAPHSIQYQVIAVLVGYSIALRSSCGLWNDPISCIDTLLLSCPILDLAYKPQSLSGAINHWCTTCTCPTLLSRSARSTEAVLKDVRVLLMSDIFFKTVLLDCWLLACADVGYVTPEAVSGVSGGHLPKASVLLPLLQEYEGIFKSRVKKNTTPSELLARKVYFIMSSCFSSSENSWRTNLGLEVEVYCEEYLRMT